MIFAVWRYFICFLLLEMWNIFYGTCAIDSWFWFDGKISHFGRFICFSGFYLICALWYSCLASCFLRFTHLWLQLWANWKIECVSKYHIFSTKTIFSGKNTFFANEMSEPALTQNLLLTTICLVYIFIFSIFY